VTVYAVDKLIGQARQLAADYRRTTGKPLPGISNEIAEHDAANALGLELCEDRSTGFDAVGRDHWPGQRFQIKGRTIFDETKSGQRIGQLKIDKEWDSVLLILMNEDYETYEIHKADREDLLEYLDDSSNSRRRRGAMSVARFRIIGRPVWTPEFGLEVDDVWDNDARD